MTPAQSEEIAVTLADLPIGVAFEIEEWLNNTGRSVGEVSLYAGVMTDPEDIAFWLETKLRLEGDPPDRALIDAIEEITTPVILDGDQSLCVEGRHRLTAALAKRLPVPIVTIAGRVAA